MLKSSAVEILRTFTKEEYHKFEDFLASPYHNKNTGVIKLFMALKKYTPVLQDPASRRKTSGKRSPPVSHTITV